MRSPQAHHRQEVRQGRHRQHPGDIIELQITDVGKKGDGVGKFHDYLVVVPGTVKGAKIHAKISKISAKTAFAVPTTEACTR